MLGQHRGRVCDDDSADSHYNDISISYDDSESRVNDCKRHGDNDKSWNPDDDNSCQSGGADVQHQGVGKWDSRDH